MSSVFVSYAREDQALVRRLHESLDRLGREAWVDWEGIPPTAEWMNEIRRAIDGAEAALFVLSPDWTASHVCGVELEHAVRQGKRLVPVLWREQPEGGQVPEALAKLNWILLREADDFEQGIANLVAALDTDLAWVQEHTRLLVRAQRWEDRGRDDANLLRGRELDEAERWLGSGTADKDPAPVPLQGALISSSREAATKRQRIVRALGVSAFVVTATLAAWAYVERGRAVDAQHEAERQRDIAVARQLGAQAELMRTQQPDRLPLALLMSTESLRLQPQAIETQLSLRRMLAEFPRPLATLPQAGMVTHVAFSPDGSLVAAAAAPAGSLSRVEGLKVIAPLPGADRRVVFSPDGRRIAGCCNGVGVWNLAGERELALTPSELRGEPRQIAFSPDGQRMAIGVSGGHPGFVVYDMGTKQVVTRYAIDLSGEASAMAFGPDGSLYFAPRDVIEVHPGGGEAVGSWLEPKLGGIQWLAIDPRGQFLAAAGNAQVTVFDLSAPGSPPTQLEAGSSGPGRITELAFSTNGDHLAAVGDLDTGTVWSRGSWRAALRISHQELQSITAIAVDSASPRAVSCATDGYCFTWSLRTGERQQRLAHVHAHSGAADDASRQMLSAAIAPGGAMLATGGADRTLRLWDLALAGLASREACADDDYRIRSFGPDTPGWMRDGNRFQPNERGCRARPGKVQDAIAIRSHGALDIATLPVDRLIVSDRASGKLTATLTQDDPIDWDAVQARLIAQGTTSMRAYLPRIETMKSRGSTQVEAVSASGRWLVSYRDADLKLRLWDTSTQRTAHVETLDAGPPWWLHFISDTQLLRIERGGGVSLRRVPEDTPLWTHDGGDIQAIALNTDASRLAWVVNKPEPTWVVLDTATGKPTLQQRLPRPAGELLFSANGRHIVVFDETDIVPEGLPIGAGLTVWDVTAGRAEVDVAKEDRIVAVALPSDGSRFAAVGRDGLLRVWNLADGQQIAKAVTADPGPLAFSANGEWLALGHGSLSVLDAKTLQTLAQLDLDGEIRQVEFQSGDKLLAVKRFENQAAAGTQELYAWREEDLLAQACQRMPADAAKQWQQLFPGQPLPKACGR